MLHVLLVGLALWLAAGWVATIPFARVSFTRIFNPLVQEASYIAALVLLWRGHFLRSSVAYLAGTWLWATLICFSYGGIHSPGALLYVSLPASAAWLLGYTAAKWTAGGCLFSALVFTVLEMTQVRPPLQAQATPLGIWFVIVQAALINAIPVGQIIGRLRETLQTLASELRERTRSEKEVQALSARLLHAQEEERSRLARELHDDLSQQLALVGIEVSTLRGYLPRDSADAVAQTIRIHERLQELLEGIRRLSHDLHPPVLEYVGLDAALRNYCDEHTARSSHRIHFKADGPADGIPRETALCVYRVAQEAVQNSIKHAHSDRVEVFLRRVPEGLSLVVSDHGVGLRSGARGGLGLVSMKERARLVNGTVDVSGKVGGGVTVTLKVPIPAEDGAVTRQHWGAAG